MERTQRFYVIICILFFSYPSLIHTNQTLREGVTGEFNDGKSVGYARIAEEYIPSLGAVELVAEPQEQKPIIFEKLLEIPDQQKRQIIFELFERTTPQQIETTISFPVQTLAYDLNLFCFHSKDPAQRGASLISKISHVTSIVGEAELSRILAEPITDSAQLYERQQLIHTLLEKPIVRTTCIDAIEAAYQKEAAFVSCFIEPSKMEREQVNRLFFQNSLLRPLNGNEVVLNILEGFNRTWTLCPLVLDQIAGLAVLQIAKHYTPIPTTFWEDVQNVGANLVEQYNPVTYKATYDRALQLGAQSNLSTTASSIAGVLAILIQSILPLAKAHWAYRNVRHAMEINEINKHIQRKLMGCAAIVRSFDALVKLSHTEPAMHMLYKRWSAETPEFSHACKRLMRLLRSRTFSGNPSYLSNVGRIRTAYTLLESCKDELAHLMKFIGQVDAYCSIAVLYEEENNNGNPWTFVTFIDQKEPMIEAINFRNPMLDSDTAVPNTISFSGSGLPAPRAALVTGSNSGGKSTIMVTGLSSVLYLAQTIGIAPAESLRMTPFNYIATSLKVTDNIVSGASHFVAETKHAAELAQILDLLPSDARVFFAIDELFEGTTSEVGSQSLHTFATSLLKHPNLIFVIATQYQADPTKLEADSNGLCKNYKVDVIAHPNGYIERPYKIEPGVSNVSIGAHLLEEALAATGKGR